MKKRLAWAAAIIATLAITFTIVAEMHGDHHGQEGKIQLLIVAVANAEQTVEGKRLFSTHAPFMKATHHQEGDKALLRYNVSMAPELSDPLDPESEPTGNTIFILAEVYESGAGVADHFEQAAASWGDFDAFMAWAGATNAMIVPAAPIAHSLW
ncbi:hypothetical protein HN371_16810 [Candidatus Poribacteria bacterium]|jgi:hypothetical protein|nr:hypothetical protein [Candidatus Poribacteria bacterium]MBT5712563.1 hypothetical protein [Candidatus Poribacteria bacterium]MBT7101813.1 hypothetical protein [Candidatus Poribacteria bacterium]MBT7805582.1 hypothetical protein [Candidatus Poribacteria bacterium]